MFKWLCFVVGVLALGFVCWCLYDIRVKTIEVLANAKVMAATGAKVSGDVEDVRTVLGVTKEGTTFLRYSTKILAAIRNAGSNAKIGVGEKMKDAVSAEEWANKAGVEAMWLALRGGSPEKIRERLSKTLPLRNDYYIKIGDGAPQKLNDWILANVKEE